MPNDFELLGVPQDADPETLQRAMEQETRLWQERAISASTPEARSEAERALATLEEARQRVTGAQPTSSPSSTGPIITRLKKSITAKLVAAGSEPSAKGAEGLWEGTELPDTGLIEKGLAYYAEQVRKEFEGVIDARWNKETAIACLRATLEMGLAIRTFGWGQEYHPKACFISVCTADHLLLSHALDLAELGPELVSELEFAAAYIRQNSSPEQREIADEITRRIKWHRHATQGVRA